ncbi:NCS2 family permease [Bradyrhizobium sp. WYCCWR 13023]|uniref:NCS2 family permease n=1 Tax=Bradyrhizobium zhengyangense TaxID=2911009 RepID=A0A9X1UF34_9BRAD|nr:NCS2 family permease [Bradyrhizobium zhengyangense]MCG2626042.1 NCS2 family permease [Bradyrhizobium zhengyangense]
MDEMTKPQAASEEPAPRQGAGLLDRTFRLTERGTSVGREMMAGATTFAAMAYIIAVNPAIMSNAGMDRADLVSATALAAIFGSVMMGSWANLPLAVAPAMGSNVIFTYVIVKQMGMPWQGALAMVAFTGVLFLILSLSKLREKVAKDVPEALKIGIQAAVGTLIVFIALRGAGFVVQNPSTYIAMGSLRSPPVLLTLFGLLLTPVLVVRRVPAALILSIVLLTVIGFFVPGANGKMVTSMPSAIMSWPRWPTSTFMALDVGYLFSHFVVALPLLFYFLCAEFFSTLGTLIGVTGAANLRKPDGSIPNATAAFATDATASIVGPLFGTSVVTAYIESITGVQAGGRTGLTSLTVAGFFFLALFFWPIFVIIPSQATAPALVLVGVLMMQGLARIDMTDLGNAIPIVLTLLVTVLTNNLINGMALGTLSYIALEVTIGRRSRIPAMVWGLGVVFIVYAIVTAQIF